MINKGVRNKVSQAPPYYKCCSFGNLLCDLVTVCLLPSRSALFLQLENQTRSPANKRPAHVARGTSGVSLRGTMDMLYHSIPAALYRKAFCNCPPTKAILGKTAVLGTGNLFAFLRHTKGSS